MNAIKLRLQALLKHKRLVQTLKIAFPIAVIIFVFFQGKKELSRFSLKESLHAIRLISSDYFTGLIVLGGMAVATMFFYDVLLLRSIKVPVSLGKTFRISWISNTFNGIVGFGGIAGVGIRTILYREFTGDVNRLLIAIAWMAPSMISGLSLLGILVICGVFPASVLLAAKGWLWIVLIGVALFFPAYLAFSRWKGRTNVSAKLTFGYTIVSFIEWLAAGSVAYVILFLLKADITYFEVIGIFTVSAIAGLISMVPGGFGTFDITYLVGLQALGVADSTVFTALLLYRIVYYFIPFAVGLIFAAFEFGGVAVKKFEDHPTLASYIESGSIIWFIQRSLWNSLSSWSVVILMFMTSIFLATYTLSEPYWDQSAFILPFFHGDIYPIVNGIVLGTSLLMLLMLKGLFERTIRAYVITSVALGLCTLLTFLIGTSIRHTLWLAGMLLFLILLRPQFTRYRYPVTKSMIVFTTLFMSILLLFYTLVGFILAEYTAEAGAAAYTLTYSQFTTTLLTGLTAAFLLYTIGYIVFERHLREPLGRNWRTDDDPLLTGGNAWMYRVIPNKRIFAVHGEKIRFPFIIKGRRVIMLGMPVLNCMPSKEHDALFALYEQADRYGLDIVFHQVGMHGMPLLHDYGNDFIKIGETARYELTEPKNGPPLHRYEVLHYPLDPYLVNEVIHTVNHWDGQPPGYGPTLKQLLTVGDEALRLVLLHSDVERCIGYAVLRWKRSEQTMTIEDIRTKYAFDHPEQEHVLKQLQDILVWLGQHHHCNKLVSSLIPLSHVETYRAPYLWSERTAIAMFRQMRDLYPLSNQRRLWEKLFDVSWEPQYIAFRKQRHMNWTVWRVTRTMSRIRWWREKDHSNSLKTVKMNENR
ncbi:flippase-like domain-containing protein [Paenibacillus sp. MER TA 81-3]|uniref:flippase-like domain-containing protein n=1 Tax=Paenibacillus sp. MER TA 81-3 TaxID=2939573 RepID=UPI00203BD775|nr:flippase-like domain-containing protein [Paenibacillus sp. MER TA 81-3]MCM3341091.1 flippase-like domain-containing protein [Paenibacillus sp. MER TA 81-3]